MEELSGSKKIPQNNFRKTSFGYQNQKRGGYNRTKNQPQSKRLKGDIIITSQPTKTQTPKGCYNYKRGRKPIPKPRRGDIISVEKE